MIGRLPRPFGGRTLGDILRSQRGHWHGGPTFVLSFDVELRADCTALPEVVALLGAHGLQASFACIGAWVDEHAAEHRAALAGGHELLNHTDRHPPHDELGGARPFSALADDELEREISGADAKLRGIGARPRGFRSPHFGAHHTRRVYPILRRLGLGYSSSTVGGRGPHGGAPFSSDGVWEIPLLPCPRHPSLALDSWHCTMAPDAAHRDRDDLVRTHAEALALLRAHGAFGSVYWDPRVVLQHDGYRRVIELIAERNGIRVTTYERIVSELGHPDPTASSGTRGGEGGSFPVSTA